MARQFAGREQLLELHVRVLIAYGRMLGIYTDASPPTREATDYLRAKLVSCGIILRLALHSYRDVRKTEAYHAVPDPWKIVPFWKLDGDGTRRVFTGLLDDIDEECI